MNSGYLDLCKTINQSSKTFPPSSLHYTLQQTSFCLSLITARLVPTIVTVLLADSSATTSAISAPVAVFDYDAEGALGFGLGYFDFARVKNK